MTPKRIYQKGMQHVSKPKSVLTRLTRNEAVAYALGAIIGDPPPFLPSEYPGGCAQILADAMCVSPESIRNYAAIGRRTL